LPARNLVVLRDGASKGNVLELARDYALFLLDADGLIAAWYAGAERIYGYKSEEVIGQHVSTFFPDAEANRRIQENLNRAAKDGHSATESSHPKRDGSRFWANAVTMALKDQNDDLQGFAIVVRDFTDRHERDEKLRRSARETFLCLYEWLGAAS
jgi:PAS domain S-box-containing protein